MGDTKYLFNRDQAWRVKVAVPRSLRDTPGCGLSRSLKTHERGERIPLTITDSDRAKPESVPDDSRTQMHSLFTVRYVRTTWEDR